MKPDHRLIHADLGPSMTSNAGAREMSVNSIGFGSQEADIDSKGLRAVEKIFSPEFRNRLDGIVQFNHLSKKVMEMIVDKFIKELNDQLQDRRVVVKLTEAARSRLAELGYDSLMGARPMGRVIQTEIKDFIADELLFGQLAKGGVVVVDRAGSKDDVADIPAVNDSGEFVFTFE